MSGYCIDQLSGYTHFVIVFSNTSLQNIPDTQFPGDFDRAVDEVTAATQRLLEACLDERVKSSLQRFVYSSSSSVYGDQTQLPVTEKALPAPRSRLPGPPWFAPKTSTGG